MGSGHMTEEPIKVDLSLLLTQVIDDVVRRFADIMTPGGANALLTEASLYCAVRDACDQKAKLADALAKGEPA
jgi:hypothetical protein